MGRRRAALTSPDGLMHSFHKVCLLAMPKMRTVWAWMLQGLAILALVLTGSPCFPQSAPTESLTVETSKSKVDLFRQVIANQKRMAADLKNFERVERVKIRKTASDPNPSEVKVW